MITTRTKIQLLVFVVITLLGVTYVGARYARLDRLFFDDRYTVVAHFADSGGAYAGGVVTYRGVTVGQVEKMVLTEDGVDLHLGIDNKWDRIPRETLAVVANRSAVGEQFVDLQPMVDGGPYLKGDSEIPVQNTRLPIPPMKLLEDLSTTVESVDKEALRTAVTELGLAFAGTGESLGQIIDTSNSFIETANANFDITTALIQDSNVVLNTQLASASAIRSFAKDLAAFSTTVAGADKDLRKVIDTGSATATQLRTFIEDNQVDLAGLLNNLRTVQEITVAHLDGLEQVLVLYPYVVEGGHTVVARNPQTKKYDAHFGMILTETPPVCHGGYENSDTRSPYRTENDRDMYVNARCTEPPTKSNPRGAQNAPRAATSYSSPVVAAFDPETGELSWNPDTQLATPRGSVGVRDLGEESWTWLLLQPLMTAQ